MKRIVILICILMPVLLVAQESSVGNWMMYFGNWKLNSKWNVHHEVQYRNYNAIGDLEQLLLRTGIGYNITDNANLLVGYGYILSGNYVTPDTKAFPDEHRIYQQFITNQSLSRLKLQHRYRFEQRWLADNFKLRVRYFLSARVPLNHKDMIDKTWYLSAYNEIFIQNEGNIFDRNRIYAGAGYQLNKGVRFEAGVMNQLVGTQGRAQANAMVFISF